MPHLHPLIVALALLPCGWFAATWYYGRRLRALQAQLHAVRQTAAEHAQQARRQVGQLQAELAARPPLRTTDRGQRDGAVAQAPTRVAGAAQAPAASELSFAATAMLSDGFPQTVLVRPPPRR